MGLLQGLLSLSLGPFSMHYLRRERPPSCVHAIRVAQIQGCTRTSVARPPVYDRGSAFTKANASGVFVQSVPDYLF